jgi:hypothetical protein
MDRGAAEIGQHYEIFNERVIAKTRCRPAANRADGEALAAVRFQRDHDASVKEAPHAVRRV